MGPAPARRPRPIGSSFAGIFYDNCAHNGLLAVASDEAAIKRLVTRACRAETNAFSLDLPRQTIRTGDGSVFTFPMETDRKQALVQGLDAIGTTLAYRDEIASFERIRLGTDPWLA